MSTWSLSADREGSQAGVRSASSGRFGSYHAGSSAGKGRVLWWLWALFDDIAEALAGLIRGGLYSRRQLERTPIPDRSMPFSKAWETLVMSGFDVKVSRLERRPAPVM